MHWASNLCERSWLLVYWGGFRPHLLRSAKWWAPTCWRFLERLVTALYFDDFCLYWLLSLQLYAWTTKSWAFIYDGSQLHRIPNIPRLLRLAQPWRHHPPCVMQVGPSRFFLVLGRASSTVQRNALVSHFSEPVRSLPVSLCRDVGTAQHTLHRTV